MDEALIADLMRCIAKRCRPIAQQPDKLRQHAIRIWWFRENHESAMRRFSGQDVLLDLDRHLRLAEAHILKFKDDHPKAFGSVIHAMPSLTIEDREAQRKNVQPIPHTVRRRFEIERTNRNGEVEKEVKEDCVEVEIMPQNPDKLSNRLEAIASLRAGLSNFKRSNVGKAAPLTTSEGTEPAAIASACRQTWREVYGEAKVPKAPRANPLGPMARFIDDVFDICGLSSDGDLDDARCADKPKRPNPVSALRFVDRMGGDEALAISLSWE